MNKSNLLFHSFIILSSAIFCHKTIAEPQNIDIYKNELKKYHDSGKYIKEIAQISYQIEEYIENKTAHQTPQKMALILDIDETSLSNYSSIIERDFTGNRDIIHRDIIKAKAQAIEPIKHLFNFAKAHHVDIFFVSGRFESEKQATVKNLHEQGYHGWKQIFFKTDQYHQGPNALEHYKTLSRKTVAEQGYTILANVGDQESDLQGGYALRTFKLPNPFYRAI